MENVEPAPVKPVLKLLGGVICTWIYVVFSGPQALADEQYKETRAYQEYILLPNAYKTPEMEAKFKHRYDAETAVKNHLCVSGGTISECLDATATNQGHEDLGWSTRGDVGRLVVERVFVTWNGNAITYRWSVDASGNVKAQNQEAKKISIK